MKSKEPLLVEGRGGGKSKVRDAQREVNARGARNYGGLPMQTRLSWTLIQERLIT